MVIGKIDYINLLPFYVYLKKVLSSQEKQALNFYKGVPSQINHLFKKRRVEAAVVSSVVSEKYRCSDFGIVAKGKVLSVLLCPGEEKEDLESNTSNILAKVLNLQGKVVIGDKALKIKQKDCIDLAQRWYEEYKLPFVFARFCFWSRSQRYQKLADNFLRTKVKIPSYILKKYSKKSGLSRKEIEEYLKLINYRLGVKEKIALKKFLKKKGTLRKR
ncbi:MAG: hypothetical protein GXO61_05710 [Epsilonproteobacteria bacterium]|nr:hypothetical protein [Campylobacterota bacterium]